MNKLDKTQTQKLLKLFLSEFKAYEVLPSLKLEYEEVSFWRGLWLRITRQERPVKYPPLPECKGDTITFKRPLYTFGESTIETDGVFERPTAEPQPHPASDQQ